MASEPLWSGEEAAAAAGGEARGSWIATGVSIDSRTLAPGDLFIAIAGPNKDGHVFVADALTRGASVAMVARGHALPGGVDTAKLFLVDDTMAGLARLGAAARNRSHAKIVGVTGSVGKTSIKEALRLALSRVKPAHASELSYNNHWGVPLSLARMPRDAAFGVFELGMNHPGELGPLAKLVRPHVAIVTTVEAVHTAFFNSAEEIADAKAEIFLGVEPGGTAILNRDNRHFGRLAERARQAGVKNIVSFGEDAAADARLIKCKLHDACSCVTANILGTEIAYRIGIAGKHWVINSLGVLAAVSAVGGDLGLAGLALADLSPLKGRGQRHVIARDRGSFTLIDESYNASPVAMRAAIQTLANVVHGEGGRRIAALGDMLELGPEAGAIHASLAEDLVKAGIDLVFTAGPNMAWLAEALPKDMRGGHAETSLELAPVVARAVRPGDVVMVKGSLGSRMARVVDALKAFANGSTATAARG